MTRTPRWAAALSAAKGRWGAIRARSARTSLRTRLVALVLALLLVTCAVVGAVSVLALRGFLLNRLDQQLTAAGDRYAVALEHQSDADTDDSQFQSVVGQTAGTLGARVAAGKVTAAGVVGVPGQPSGAGRTALARVAPARTPRTLRVPDLGEYRILATPGHDGDLLIVGLPERSVDETIGRLAAIEAVVFAGALLVTGAVGAVGVRRSLLPLRRVARTAQRVSALPLAAGEVSLPERVPATAPGTEVGQVAEAFNHMLEHVESALSARHASEERLRDFIADASHELRTPVSVIGSHAEFALRTSTDLPPRAREALSRIEAEADRMGHLVQDLLLLARLDAGRPLVRDDVDLSRLAIDAVSDARVGAPGHHWELDLPEEPVTVIGDPEALHQALSNLLANARTHTPPGTTVVVAARETADGVELSVRDDGPGIPAEVVPQVFGRFVRADGARSHAGGNAGLGLSIVDAIVRAHGGEVTVTSAPGNTEFRIALLNRARSTAP